MKITGRTRLAGIFGYPIEHTLSPAIHNDAFERLGIDACYLPFAVEPKNLRGALQSLIPLGFLGVNLTVPHKEAAIRWLGAISEEAELIGAVNTVVVKEGELIGYNTDSTGFLNAVRNELHFKPEGKDVLIIGAGGSARAVIGALAPHRVRSILIANRTFARAQRLSQEFHRRFPKVPIAPIPLSRKTLEKRVGEVDLVVQTTSAGVTEGLPIEFSWKGAKRSTVAFDLVYRPAETPFLKGARSAGLRGSNGLGMLLYQAAASFKLWTNRQMPIASIRKNLLQKGDLTGPPF